MDSPSGIHASPRFAGRAFSGIGSRWLLLATCLVSFALFAARINEGFIGADDGTLADAAERVCTANSHRWISMTTTPAH